jgi:hypothetical protein
MVDSIVSASPVAFPGVPSSHNLSIRSPESWRLGGWGVKGPSIVVCFRRFVLEEMEDVPSSMSPMRFARTRDVDLHVSRV